MLFHLCLCENHRIKLRAWPLGTASKRRYNSSPSTTHSNVTISALLLCWQQYRLHHCVPVRATQLHLQDRRLQQLFHDLVHELCCGAHSSFINLDPDLPVKINNSLWLLEKRHEGTNCWGIRSWVCPKWTKPYLPLEKFQLLVSMCAK